EALLVRRRRFQGGASGCKELPDGPTINATPVDTRISGASHCAPAEAPFVPPRQQLVSTECRSSRDPSERMRTGVLAGGPAAVTSSQRRPRPWMRTDDD